MAVYFSRPREWYHFEDDPKINAEYYYCFYVTYLLL